LQDEIEQWQQNGDEKSLNNGTIFMKCYLGHSSIHTTEVYADVMEPDIQDALRELYK